ncbi:hypothetical protein GOBAR_AA26524 [Gossypium barbadense]|uniref:Uncharacterized protein n=1 Tax=Gossypium barbadense TaxID=3634 RepID=A0A2P5WST1_GOSBA|nr:hypothetical protein GOBAR_AA26524 [Gossypium barbadense]
MAEMRLHSPKAYSSHQKKLPNCWTAPSLGEQRGQWWSRSEIVFSERSGVSLERRARCILGCIQIRNKVNGARCILRQTCRPQRISCSIREGHRSFFITSCRINSPAAHYTQYSSYTTYTCPFHSEVNALYQPLKTFPNGAHSIDLNILIRNFG